MKLSRFIAIRQITRNKKKSIPIFLCMFIAMSILVNLFGMYESYQEMVLEDTKENYGAYHFYINNATDEECEIIKNSSLVETYGEENIYEIVELTEYIGDSLKTEQQFVCSSMDDVALEMNMLRLMSGKMPEKEDEILISAGVELHEGYAYDEIKGGEKLKIKGADGIKKEYTITGVLDNFNAGQIDTKYVAIINNFKSGMEKKIYVTVNKEGNIYDNIESITSELGYTEEQVYKSGNRIIDTDDSVESYKLIYNGELLHLINEGTGNDATKTVMYVTQILIVFILLVATMIIWNIYSILIQERREEYGLLRVCGVSSMKILKICWTENVILFLGAFIVSTIFANIGKILTQQIIQFMRISSMMKLKIAISWEVLFAGAVFIGIIVFLITTITTIGLIRNVTPIQLLNGEKKETYKRKIRSKCKAFYQVTAGFLIGKRNIFRNKTKTASVVASLGIVVMFFVTLSSFIEIIESKVVDDVTMLVDCQYTIFKNTDEAFTEEFIESIPNTEFKYTTSTSMADFKVSPEIKNEELKEYYNRFYSEYTNEEIFMRDEWRIEISGISKEEYEKLEWFDGEKLSYEEWEASGKGLLEDICVQTDKDGSKTYMNQLNINPIDYTFSYSGENSEWDNGMVTEFDGGEITLCGRVGHKLFCREDNMIHLMILLPESIVREKIDPYNQMVSINAVKGKETELGAWLRKNSVKHDYNIMDDVKKYAACHDNQTTKKVILRMVFLIVVLISMIHIYNVVKSNLNARKKEQAVLMAIGMKRWQIQKSILWEHAIYGVVGGIFGSVVSVALLEKLLKLLSGASKINMVIPWNYLIMGFCGAVIISLVVAMSATYMLAKTSIVEEIREND